ncbi:hypothetical protein EVAR_100724_1 [Eumeta japonica]|uniref:Uncharacterized protein n=1 Tax=Eumeta variegata TaxID=151549 RepID=A0A4C1ZZV8_EUMVA|nr:hypothetical protein EVAR_100724_1 [Eumeta japonica]
MNPDSYITQNKISKQRRMKKTDTKMITKKEKDPKHQVQVIQTRLITLIKCKEKMHFSSCAKDHTHSQTRTFIETNTPKTGYVKHLNKPQQIKHFLAQPILVEDLHHHSLTKRYKVHNIATLNTRTLQSHESSLVPENTLENVKFDILGRREIGEKKNNIEIHGPHLIAKRKDC